MIRVLRVLEYEYDTHATFEKDREGWTEKFKTGPMTGGTNKRMTSEIVRVQELPDPPAESTPT